MIDAVVTATSADGPVIRVVLRDPGPFPNLLNESWDELLAELYGEIVDWLRDQQVAGRITVDDPAATVAVLLASLTYYRLLEILSARTPGNLNLRALVAAWVESTTATLHLTTGDNP